MNSIKLGTVDGNQTRRDLIDSQISLTAQKLVPGIGNDPISAPYQDAANPFQLTGQ